MHTYILLKYTLCTYILSYSFCVYIHIQQPHPNPKLHFATLPTQFLNHRYIIVLFYIQIYTATSSWFKPNFVNHLPSLKLTVRPWTLPTTSSSPLKMGHPKRKLVFQPSIFRCKRLVCFREGIPLVFVCFLSHLWRRKIEIQAPKNAWCELPSVAWVVVNGRTRLALESRQDRARPCLL